MKHLTTTRLIGGMPWCQQVKIKGKVKWPRSMDWWSSPTSTRQASFKDIEGTQTDLAGLLWAKTCSHCRMFSFPSKELGGWRICGRVWSWTTSSGHKLQIWGPFTTGNSRSSGLWTLKWKHPETALSRSWFNVGKSSWDHSQYGGSWPQYTSAQRQ